MQNSRGGPGLCDVYSQGQYLVDLFPRLRVVPCLVQRILPPQRLKKDKLDLIQRVFLGYPNNFAIYPILIIQKTNPITTLTSKRIIVFAIESFE